MPENLLSALASGRPLLSDGAMGTQLQAAGLSPGGCGEAWNRDRPAAVRAIHRAYLAAGSDAVITNSFGASRIRLGDHGEGDCAVELNRAAAALAREAAGPERWVLGDIGPFGGFLEPLGTVTPAELEAAFLEQARALLEGGADALIIETQTAVEEMQIAVRAARAAGAPAVIASFAFDHNVDGVPRTMMGVDANCAVAAMLAAGVDAVGCNCGALLEHGDLLAILSSYRDACSLPLVVQPNAGQPELTPAGVLYRERPEDMAVRILELVDAGATLVGGCCGTAPEHIAAFRHSLDSRSER